MILQVIFSAVFSGLMLSAAIPNEFYLFGCPVFTLFAFIPLYLIFNKIKDFKTAFLAFFLQTLTTHLFSSFWLAYFKDFAIFTLGASAFGTACIGGAFGLFFFIPYFTTACQNKLNDYSAASCSHWLSRSSPIFRIFYFAALYTLYEWVKSAGFLGYPWGTVSSAMFKWPVIMQLSSVTGTYGVTFIILMFNGLAAEGLQLYFGNQQLSKARIDAGWQVAKLFGILFALILLHGFYQYDKPRKPVKELTTINVQQNSDPWKEDSDDESILTSQRLTQEKLDELSMTGRRADLVVWSEGCLHHAFPNGESYYSWNPSEKPLSDFVEEIGVPCIFGGSVVRRHGEAEEERKEYFNAALLYDADGKYRGYYAKNHLVPFAESLPFMEIPAVHAFMSKVVGISAGWTPGDQYVYFNVPCRITENYKLPAVKNINLNKSWSEQRKEDNSPYTVKISVPICFDDAFTDIMRPLFLNGTELFINITDDSWSLKKSSELQHFVIASYRAIEYRTTLVRSTNAGYSVVLDPAGKVIADLPLFEEAALATDIPVFQRQMTTYARFGNWLPYLCLIALFASAVWSYFDFSPCDYIPSERKIKKAKKNSKKVAKKTKKNSKNKQ